MNVFFLLPSRSDASIVSDASYAWTIPLVPTFRLSRIL